MDRYRIVTLLGRGSIGEVYRTDDLKLGQTVAPVSFVRSWATRDGESSQARMPHDYACRHLPDFRYRRNRRQMFISMEYIDGETLSSLSIGSAACRWTKPCRSRGNCAWIMRPRPGLNIGLRRPTRSTGATFYHRFRHCRTHIAIGERIETAGTPDTSPRILKARPADGWQRYICTGIGTYEILTATPLPRPHWMFKGHPASGPIRVCAGDRSAGRLCLSVWKRPRESPASSTTLQRCRAEIRYLKYEDECLRPTS